LPLSLLSNQVSVWKGKVEASKKNPLSEFLGSGSAVGVQLHTTIAGSVRKLRSPCMFMGGNGFSALYFSEKLWGLAAVGERFWHHLGSQLFMWSRSTPTLCTYKGFALVFVLALKMKSCHQQSASAEAMTNNGDCTTIIERV
jgi:hypothetical protein